MAVREEFPEDNAVIKIAMEDLAMILDLPVSRVFPVELVISERRMKVL